MTNEAMELWACHGKAIVGRVPYYLTPMAGEAEDLLESSEGSFVLYKTMLGMLNKGIEDSENAERYYGLFEYNGQQFVVQYVDGEFRVFTPKVFAYLMPHTFDVLHSVGAYRVLASGNPRRKEYYSVKTLSGTEFRIYGVCFVKEGEQ